eukprot:TRINITY_DN309_c0_g1_i8.p1 TRINITY_DN309_c0_g1~~TRINITY_DN309_c0_g1_i8.p1  ORF type:complete len:331 (+),score=89.80 TRINITY_DN309_c0_g1_i8:63-1055(+)
MEITTPQVSLSELFAKGSDLWIDIESGTAKDSKSVHEAIECFLSVHKIVKNGDFFSSNEQLSDVPTPYLKYLSIPYYLGQLYQKIPATSGIERFPHVKQAKIYFEEFMETCVRFEIINKKDLLVYQRKGNPDPETRRTEKIERYKREKELNQKIQKSMKEKLSRGLNISDLEEEPVEDEFERETSILMLRLNSMKTLEAINVIRQEVDMLEQITKLMSENGGNIPKPTEPERRPFTPIILTDPRKEIAQKAFLPGWNLPTVSIEQAGLIDLQIAQEQQRRHNEMEKKNKLVKEYGDDEDETKLKEKREMDDWKDDHPRGSGNTGTKGYRY